MVKNKRKIKTNTNYGYLSQEQIDLINREKSIKQSKEAEKIYEQALKFQRERTPLGQIKKFISQPAQRTFKPQNVKFVQTLNPAPALSKEQNMLQEMFNGEQTFGTGQNLPEVNGILRSGGGLINNGDADGETGSMFGMRKNSYGFNQGEGGY